MGILRRLFGADPDSIDTDSGDPGSPQRASPEGPPVPTDPVEVLCDGLERLRTALEGEDWAMRERTPEQREVLAEVERIREFVEKQRLDSALIWLFEKIRHYPSWSRREDWDRSKRFPLEDIEGEKDEEKGEIVRFTLSGVRLDLRFRSYRYPYDSDPTEFAVFGLYDQTGKALLVVSATRSGMNYDERWRPTKVDAFQTGEWALHLMDLYTREDKKRARDLHRMVNELDKVDELRESFGLGRDDEPSHS